MDYADLFTRLWRLRRAMLAIVAVAFVIFLLSLFRISLFPPGLGSKQVTYGQASGQLIVDTDRSPISDLRRDFEGLSRRAALYTAIFQSQAVKVQILRAAGLPPDAELTINSATGEASSGSIQRSALAAAGARTLSTQSSLDLPLISVQATAPTEREAVRLADAAVRGAQGFLRDLQRRDAVPNSARAELRPLGPAQGNAITSGPTVGGALVNGFIVVAVLAGLLLVVDVGIINPPTAGRLADESLPA